MANKPKKEIEFKSRTTAGLADSAEQLTTLIDSADELKDKKPEESLLVAEEALKIAEQHDDQKAICAVCKVIAIAHHTIGNWQQSLEYNLKAIKLSDSIGFTEKTADIALNLGNVYMSIGDYDQAIDYFRKCVALSEKIGKMLNRTHCLSRIGMVYERLGQWKEAMDYTEQSIACYQELEDLNGLVNARMNKGNIHYRMGEIEIARDYYLQCITLSESAGYERGLATNYLNLSNTALQFDEPKKALDYLSKTFAICDKHQFQHILSAALHIKGEALHALGQFEASTNQFQQSLELSSRIGYNELACSTHEKLAELHTNHGSWEQAFRHQTKYYELDRKIKNEAVQKKAEILALQTKLELREKEAEINRLKNVELKRALQQLQETQAELVSKERIITIGEIASRIAHEVQNPLNFINNFSEINHEMMEELVEQLEQVNCTDETFDLIEQLSKNSQSIRDHGNRVASIVSELLEKTWKTDDPTPCP